MMNRREMRRMRSNAEGMLSGIIVPIDDDDDHQNIDLPKNEDLFHQITQIRESEADIPLSDDEKRAVDELVRKIDERLNEQLKANTLPDSLKDAMQNAELPIDKFIPFMFDVGLINPLEENSQCRCGSKFKLVFHENLTDGCAWKCTNTICRTSISIRRGSNFQDCILHCEISIKFSLAGLIIFQECTFLI